MYEFVALLNEEKGGGPMVVAGLSRTASRLMSKHILTIQILHSKNFVPRYFLLFLSKAENTLVEAGYLRRHILVLHAIGSTGDIETFCHSYFPSLNKFEFKRNKTSPSQGLSSSREAWGRG